MCFWNICSPALLKKSPVRTTFEFDCSTFDDYNFLPAGISGWTHPSQTTLHTIARSTPKTLLSLLWLAQLFSKPLLSLNCTTICSHHPQRINSGFHVPFQIHILIFTNMGLISNFITFCAHQLHSHSKPSSSFKVFFILTTSLFSDIIPRQSVFPSSQKPLFPPFFNAQLLYIHIHT